MLRIFISSKFYRDAGQHESKQLLVSQASTLISHSFSGFVSPTISSCGRSDRVAAGIWQPSCGVYCNLLVTLPLDGISNPTTYLSEQAHPMMSYEKHERLAVNASPYRPKHPRPGRIIAATLLTVAALWLVNFNPLHLLNEDNQCHENSSQTLDGFDWETVEARPQLHYTPCYGKLQCARLELPMDWFNYTTKAEISLAVIRQPAVVPVTHPQYGGAILLNPGGPGGSGVGFVLMAGESARAILDTDDGEGKYFDIISFDPRGVGLSEPRVDCFHDPSVDASWQLRLQEEGWLDSSDAAFGRIWSMSDAKWQGCSRSAANDSEDIKRYVSTASVARDMLEIVERHGEWREKEAMALLATCPTSSLLTGKCSKSPQIPSNLEHALYKEKIQYYGLSYGSFLGGTFAAMFPNRVGRLLVDGVVDYENYASGNWSDNLLDTERTMDLFYFHCARVGFPQCVLANENGPSEPKDIKNRTDSIIQSLYHNPLSVYQPRADTLSYSEVRSLIFSALYNPIFAFPVLAQLLLAIEQKNEPFLAPLLDAFHPSACAAENANIMARDAQVAIMCSDGESQSYMTRAAFQNFSRALAAQSPSSGSAWSTLRMGCVHYTLPSTHRFAGPWEANTSHPLLFIGNTADPVTPGKFARDMARGFVGARTLMQDSGGHCSLAAFSRCTTGYIRGYFQTGELPPVNTTCGVDVEPFGPAPGDVVVEEEEGRVMAERHARMADSLYEHGTGFMEGEGWRRARQALREVSSFGE